MSDGVYTSFSDLPDVESVLNSAHAQPSTPRTATLPPRNTSSFDSLMKLKDLAECIEDAEETQFHITQQIEALIAKNRAATDEIVAVTAMQVRVAFTKESMEKTKLSVHRSREDRANRKTKLSARRSSMIISDRTQRAGEDELANSYTRMKEQRILRNQTSLALAGQVRRLTQDILDIFPIDAIDRHPLCFTICLQYLPNARVLEGEPRSSSFSNGNSDGPQSSEEATAAALGFIAQILCMLENFLGIALPYSVFPRGSTSTIFDPLSSAAELGLSASSSLTSYVLQSHNQIGSKPPSSISSASEETDQVPGPPTPATHPSRLFPLYQTSTPAKRFRWGIYLLNKDIEELMAQSGCRVLDPRNTLPNLKFLLTVLASGAGEAPERKKGVFRGLDGGTTNGASK